MTDGGGRRPPRKRPRGRSAKSVPQAPTPVRESLGRPPASGPALPEEREIDVDGRTWTAAEVGRSGGSGGRAPILAIRFTSPDGEAHEILTVGRSLAALSDGRLSALAAAIRR